MRDLRLVSLFNNIDQGNDIKRKDVRHWVMLNVDGNWQVSKQNTIHHIQTRYNYISIPPGPSQTQKILSHFGSLAKGMFAMHTVC